MSDHKLKRRILLVFLIFVLSVDFRNDFRTFNNKIDQKLDVDKKHNTKTMKLVL